MDSENKTVSVRKVVNGVAVMDNKLIDACYKMTLTQKRLFNMAVAAVNSTKSMKSGHKVAVSLDDFAELAGLSRKIALQHVRETLPDMRQAHVVDITYKDNNVFKQDFDSSQEVERVSYKNFFQEVDYIETEKELAVTFKFSDWLVPYISQLKKKFTQVRLQHVNPLSSFYSMRIYEAVVLTIQDSTGIHSRTFEIQELRNILGLQGDTYSRWVDMKKRCLVAPIKDLDEKTPFAWSLKVNGRGKYLSSVTIKAKPQSQQEMDL